MAREVLETRRSHFLLGALVLAHLVVISRQVERGGGTLLGQTVFAVLSPIQRIVGASVNAVAGTWRGYIDLRHIWRENQDLKGRVASLEMELMRQREVLREAERLREIADVKPVLPFETVVAQVVATEGTPWYRTVTLNRGTGDGVRGTGSMVFTPCAVPRTPYPAADNSGNSRSSGPPALCV